MFGGDPLGGRVRSEVEEEEEGRLGARLQLRSTCLVTLKRRKFKHIYIVWTSEQPRGEGRERLRRKGGIERGGHMHGCVTAAPL
jgi:hypothetical protein